jgi:cytochrome c553
VFDTVPVGAWAVPVRVAEAARVGQFNASLVRLSVTEGTPHDVQAVGVSSYPNGIANNNNVAAMRSYPSSLTIVQVGEKDRIAWVAMEASDTIVAIDLDKPTDEESGAFSTYERTGFDVPDGPRDVRVAPDGAPEVWLWSWLDRELVSYPVGAVNQAIREPIPQTFTPALTNRAPEPTTISEDAQAGRRFFYSANNERVMARSAGVSCSSCHPDGRSDGFSWFSEGILRQAPSLHGTVSTTGPFGWDGQVPSAKHEVTTTTTTRTGGTGLNDAEASQLVAFLDSTRDIVPPTVRNDEERALVELGREVFSREEVGCAECHNGEQGSDGENHEVFGRVVNTPRLKGIAGSAPYFRDGSAYTLAEVLERVTDGSMGDTSSLTEHEMEALEAYLLRF